MNGKNLVDIQTLRERAKKSEDKESFTVLSKNRSWRIGVGAALEKTDEPSFFFEVLIYMCPKSSKVNLSVLEEKLTILKELQLRGYSMSCQDHSCISCERTISSEDITSEFKFLKSMTKKIMHAPRI